MKEQNDNKNKMIKLSEAMIKHNSSSDSIFAPINKAIWIKKLKYWKSL